MSQEQTQQKAQAVSVITVDESGLLRPKNLDEAWKMSQWYANSGMLPSRYFKKPEMVICAMQMALELKLQPLTGICSMAVVNGTPSLFGSVALGLVQASGKMEYIKEGYFDVNGVEISLANKNLAAEVFGAFCIVKRVNDSEPKETSFTMAEARQANLYPAKPDSPWTKYTKDMLKYRARSRALKDKFADALNGISVTEDMELQTTQVIDVPKQTIFADSYEKLTLEEKLKRKADEPIDVEHSNDADTIDETTNKEVSND